MQRISMGRRIKFGLTVLFQFSSLLLTRKSSRLLAFGDSHCRSIGGWGAVAVHVGPRTLHGATRELDSNLPFESAIQTKRRILQWIYRISLDRLVSSLVVSFGEIDCRCHIGKQQYPGQAIIELAAKTSAYLLQLQQSTEKSVCFLSIVPPSPFDLNQEFPVVGSIEDRIRWTRSLNEAIAAQIHSLRNPSIHFVNLWSLFASDEGFLIPAKSDGNVHVANSWGAAIRGAIRAQLTSINTHHLDPT